VSGGRSRTFRRLAQLGIDLSGKRYLRKSYYFLVASLWLLSKYGTQDQLRDVLRDTEDLWSKSEFLSRQVAAAASKFRRRRDFEWICVKVEKHGFQSAISVVSALRALQVYASTVPNAINLYCTNGNNIGAYSIQRFLVTFRVATSKKLPNFARMAFIDRVLNYITDPHYIRVLERLR
jgi:hypothetical protein